jgi:hypothetical protein
MLSFVLTQSRSDNRIGAGQSRPGSNGARPTLRRTEGLAEDVAAMLDYVKQTDSTLTLYFRSNTRMTGPLMDKSEKLRQVGHRQGR